MNKNRKYLLTTGLIATISIPFVATVSCSSFFQEHELFDEGNFYFEYTNVDDADESARLFNQAVVDKDKYLFGASLSAQEVYDVHSTHPEIIGISPEKALTNNGIFMSNTFSTDDKRDFANYLQALWWASCWRKGENPVSGAPMDPTAFYNAPSDLPKLGTSTFADSPKVDQILSENFVDENGNPIFEKRETPVSFFNQTFGVNYYSQAFDFFKMSFPTVYYPDDMIETTYGEINAYNPSLNDDENLFDTNILSLAGTNNKEIDFNEDGITGELDQDKDLYEFLNIYAPYVYANYKPIKVNPEVNEKVRIVILDESVKIDPEVGIDNTSKSILEIFQNLFINDGLPLLSNKDPKLVGTVDIQFAETKEQAVQKLRDEDYHTIALMPITEWASFDEQTASLVASYRTPAALTSIDKVVNGNKIEFTAEKFRTDESFALGLISTYFDLWINKDAKKSPDLVRRNYSLSDLRVKGDINKVPIIDQIGELDWTDEDREVYFNPLKNLVDEYNKTMPSSPVASKFSYGAKYDYENHVLIDDVPSKLFSDGTNAIIYYSTNSDGVSEATEYNSQVIEDRIMNNHGDGKINLRNELILPVHIAMHKSKTFNDADITESVKAWIEEHFHVE